MSVEAYSVVHPAVNAVDGEDNDIHATMAQIVRDLEENSREKRGAEAKNIAVTLRGLMTQQKQIFESEKQLQEMEKRIDKAVDKEVNESISRCQQFLQQSDEHNEAELENTVNSLYQKVDKQLHTRMDELNKSNEKLQKVNKIALEESLKISAEKIESKISSTIQNMLQEIKDDLREKYDNHAQKQFRGLTEKIEAMVCVEVTKMGATIQGQTEQKSRSDIETKFCELKHKAEWIVQDEIETVANDLQSELEKEKLAVAEMEKVVAQLQEPKDDNKDKELLKKILMKLEEDARSCNAVVQETLKKQEENDGNMEVMGRRMNKLTDEMTSIKLKASEKVSQTVLVNAYRETDLTNNMASEWLTISYSGFHADQGVYTKSLLDVGIFKVTIKGYYSISFVASTYYMKQCVLRLMRNGEKITEIRDLHLGDGKDKRLSSISLSQVVLLKENDEVYVQLGPGSAIDDDPDLHATSFQVLLIKPNQ